MNLYQRFIERFVDPDDADEQEAVGLETAIEIWTNGTIEYFCYLNNLPPGTDVRLRKSAKFMYYLREKVEILQKKAWWIYSS